MYLRKYWELIHHYLSNGYSAADMYETDGEVENRQQIPLDLKMISMLTFKEQQPLAKSVDRKWSEIETEMLASDSSNVYSFENKIALHNSNNGNRNYTKFLRYAAILMLVTGLPYLMYNTSTHFGSTKQAPKEDRVVKVGNKERFSILLSDGTKVMLDAGSELRIPGDYGTNRNVYLKGEAFFEVAHDTKHPFNVYANYALVSVVGTEFNVRAWEEIPNITVTVKKGKVALSSSTDIHSMRVFLTKDKQSTIQENSNPSDPIDVNINEYTSWMNNELNFKGATLCEVLSQLERWYDYKFVVDDSLLYESHLTYHIKKTNIESFLQSISIITNTKVVKDGKKIKLIKKG
jgi:ferric-dicitrate binding protein FerR (iron transport regulator)